MSTRDPLILRVPAAPATTRQIDPEYTVPFDRSLFALLAGLPQKRARRETSRPKYRASQRRPLPSRAQPRPWKRPVAFPPSPQGSTAVAIPNTLHKVVTPA